MDDTLKLLAQYGIGGILAGIIGWVAYLIGMRMIRAIDALGEKWEQFGKDMTDRLEEHTRADIGAIATLTNRIDVLQTEIGHNTNVLERARDDIQEVLERTPVERNLPPVTSAMAMGSVPLPLAPATPRSAMRSGVIEPRRVPEPARTEYSVRRPGTDTDRKK